MCLTGVFAQLPLHAAGLYSLTVTGQGGVECVSDYCLPSYTPTVGVLLRCLRQSGVQATNPRLLLAAVSQPVGWPRLLLASDEASRVRNCVPPTILVACLGDVPSSGDELSTFEPATAQAMLCGLPHTTFLHLACHGYQDPTNPLESGFVLQDRMLTLGEILALKLDYGQMAFLSACDTAKGNKDQPNQAVHLAAAMLFLGFQSIVGTMW